MIALLKGVSLKAWGIIAAVLAVLLALLKAFDAGYSKAEAKGQKHQLDNAKVRHETDAAVDRADPAERKRLRDKWTRRE